jgi:hypothetical protein
VTLILQGARHPPFTSHRVLFAKFATYAVDELPQNSSHSQHW